MQTAIINQSTPINGNNEEQAMSDNLESMKGPELVALYNSLSESPIKRFPDRKAGIRRIRALQKAASEPGKAKAKAKATPKATPKAKGKKTTPAAKADPAQTKAKRSAGTKKSWKDPDTRHARSQRHGVSVNGEEYRSVKAAYEAFGWDLAGHKEFRALLKEKGQLTADGMKWKLIERGE